MRGKAAIPHCDFTLGWLEQSVEVFSKYFITNTHKEEKNKKKGQTHEMKYSLIKSHSKQSAPHPLHGILENISWQCQLFLNPTFNLI